MRHVRPSVRAACCAVVLLATACGGSGQAASTAAGASATPSGRGSAAATPSATTSAAPSERATPSVEVIDPGAEPRRELRLSPTEGDTTALTLSLTLSVEQTVDGQATPTVSLPSIQVGLDVTTDTVADGAITSTVAYRDVRLDGPDPGGVLQALRPLEGLTATVTLTDRGEFLDGGFAVPSGGDATAGQLLTQLQDQLATLTVPLPEPAVGQGARWRVTSRPQFNGIATEQVTTYTLTELDGEQYSLDVSVAQTFQRGTVSVAGTSLEVLSGTATASGVTSGSLSSLLPTDGSVRGTAKLSSRVDAGDGGHDLAQTVTTDVRLSGR